MRTTKLQEQIKALYLNPLLNYTQREIAEELDCSVATVEKTIKKVKQYQLAASSDRLDRANRELEKLLPIERQMAILTRIAETSESQSLQLRALKQIADLQGLHQAATSRARDETDRQSNEQAPMFILPPDSNVELYAKPRDKAINISPANRED